MKKKLLSLTMALSIMATMGTSVFASNDSMNLSDETMVSITQNNLDLAKIQEQMNEVIDPSLGQVVSQELYMEEDGGYSIGTCYTNNNEISVRSNGVPLSYTHHFYDAGGYSMFHVDFNASFAFDANANTCTMVSSSTPVISKDNGFTFTNENVSKHSGWYPRKWASIRIEFTSTTSTGTSRNRFAEFRVGSDGEPIHVWI